MKDKLPELFEKITKCEFDSFVYDVYNAEESIRKAIKQNAKFSHNVITLTLISLSKKYNNEVANYLVDKCKLTKLYGIKKIT